MSLPPRGPEIPKEIQPTEAGATVGPNYLTIGASGGPGLLDHCHAVHFVGVSNVLKPNPAWRQFKRELTGREWDYDFRRLFYTWTPDLTKQPFAEWVEVASRDATGGHIQPGDFWLSPNGEAHLIWSERAIDERLRERFFPDARQSEHLNYAMVRGGKVVHRRTIMETEGGTSGLSGS